MPGSVKFTKVSNHNGCAIDYTSAFNMAATSQTYAVWFYSDGLVGSTLSTIIGEGNSVNHLPLYILHSSSKFLSYYEGSVRATSSTTFTANKWWFLASTFDGGSGSGVARLYVGDQTTPVALEATSGSFTITTSSNQFSLGSYLRPTSAYYNSGKSSNMHIYDRALSLNELREIQYHPNSIPDCYIYSDLMEDSSFGLDKSGNGRNGTAISGSQTVTSSVEGPPVTFP